VSYQDILGAVSLTAMVVLVVAVVGFLIAVMVRAYRMGGKRS
jgi:preprotein translocase subunit Sss1